MLEPVAANAIDFLRSWKTGGPWILCGFSEDSPEMPQRSFAEDEVQVMSEWIEQLAADKFNIYFQVNTCRPGLNKKALKADVISVDWFHVDVDPLSGKPLHAEQTRILNELVNPHKLGLPVPTVTLFSGGGYQAFWRLAEPILLDGTPTAIEDAERYNQQIALMLRADNCHNVDRIMRLPGTINWPNKKKRERDQEPILAELVEADWSLVFQLTDFVQMPKRQDQSGGISGGANRPTVDIPSGNVRRVPLDELGSVLSQYGYTDEDRMQGVIMHGEDLDGVPIPGKDQTGSGVFLYVCADLVRHEMPDDLIYAIVSDPSYKISAHPISQGRGRDRAVARAIIRGKEDFIDESKNLGKMNATYGLVESVGGKMRILCERTNESNGRKEIEFHQKDGFLTTHANVQVEKPTGKTDSKGNPIIGFVPLGKWWLEHANRRTYSSVTFHPNREFTDVLNLWRGFNVDAVPGDCSLYLAHIKDNLCRGNQVYYDYLIGWMANRVQHPDTAGQTAVVMRGGQGTGKGTFAKHFGHLFGMHFKHVISADHITGTFNSLLRDASVVFADECFAAKDKRHSSALKSLITEETLRSEAKGLDSIETRNCVGLLMATNSDWAIAADLDDRRFFVLNVSDKQKQAGKYFAAIEKQMTSGGHEALMHKLLTHDLSDFDVRRCPKTEELRSQQEKTLEGTLNGFMLEKLEEGLLMTGHLRWREQVLKDEFMDVLYAYMGNQFTKKTGIVSWLADFTGKPARECKFRHKGQKYSWQTTKGLPMPSVEGQFFVFPSLEKCRKLWDEKYGSRDDWSEEDDEHPDDNYTPEF